LKHEALHGSQRYDEAVEAIEIMLSKLDDARDPEMQGKLQTTYVTQYLSFKKRYDGTISPDPMQMVSFGK